MLPSSTDPGTVVEAGAAERVRVLFLLGSLHAGGSERQTIELLRRIDRAVFQPQLYTVYREGALLEEVPENVPVHSYWDRFAFPRWNFPGRIWLHQCRDLAAVLRRERVDVLCDRNYRMTLLAAGASMIRGTARVSIISADPAADLPVQTGRWLALTRRVLRRVYRSSQRVVAVSEGVRESVCRYYDLPAGRVVTIHNLFDIDRLDERAIAYFPRMPSNQFHVVTLARLEPVKGIAYLIEAVAELVHRRGGSTILLWIIGDGPLRQRLEAQVRDARLESHVRFTGFQSNPLPYVRNAQLLCLPSLYEGMPNALAEAMACGTPVLASDCPSGPREMLGDGRLGTLVAPADSRALADAIQDAILNYDAWRARALPARLHLQQCYAAQIGVAKYQQLLLEASGRGSKRN